MRTAYVLGGANCVWNDLRACLGDEQMPDGMSLGIRPLHVDEAYVAVNDVGVKLPYALEAWVSYHGHFLAKVLRRQRQTNGYSKAVHYFAPRGDGPSWFDPLDNAYFPGQIHGGSSGLLAVKVSLTDLLFDRVILCGIPMTHTPHFHKSEDDDLAGWKDAESYRQGWLEALPHLRGRCFSMSGWTKELLGSP